MKWLVGAMMKTAIIIDSTAYASSKIINHPDVYELKFTSTFEKGEEYSDGSDPALLEEFYEKLKESEKLPTTSQPSVGIYEEMIKEIIEEGYDQLLAIHLSAGLSGAYQTAKMLTNMHQNEIKARVIDSKGASVLIEAMIFQGLEMLEEGFDIDRVAEKLIWVADNSTIYLTVSDLDNLVKGGRLPSSMAKFGKMLKIKPLLCIGSDGKIELLDQVRTDKKMNKRFIKIIQEDLKKYPEGIMLGFAHAMDKERMEKSVYQVMKSFPELKYRTGVLGPVIGTHTGVGSIGMGVIPLVDY